MMTSDPSYQAMTQLSGAGERSLSGLSYKRLKGHQVIQKLQDLVSNQNFQGADTFKFDIKQSEQRHWKLARKAGKDYWQGRYTEFMQPKHAFFAIDHIDSLTFDSAQAGDGSITLQARDSKYPDEGPFEMRIDPNGDYDCALSIYAQSSVETAPAVAPIPPAIDPGILNLEVYKEGKETPWPQAKGCRLIHALADLRSSQHYKFSNQFVLKIEDTTSEGAEWVLTRHHGTTIWTGIYQDNDVKMAMNDVKNDADNADAQRISFTLRAGSHAMEIDPDGDYYYAFSIAEVEGTPGSQAMANGPQMST